MALKSYEITYTKNPQCPCTEENDGKYRLYNPDTDIITHITAEGKSILELFDGKNSVNEICFLLSEIDNSYATKKGKEIFFDFVKNLAERGIIYDTQKEVVKV